MSSSEPFGSNNPFRRKTGKSLVSSSYRSPDSSDANASLDAPSDSVPKPPFTTFKSVASGSERRDEEDQPVQPRPKKIVKKVRVLSPPPSSPEDAVPVNKFPSYDDRGDDSSSTDSRDEEDHVDPFNAVAADAEDDPSTERPLPQVPPNPFSRTLQDLQQGGQSQDAEALAAGSQKGALNVDSFKRLLLTGYANIPGPATTSEAGRGAGTGLPAQGALPDGASNTDASSIPRQSLFGPLQETPRTSHEIVEAEEAEDRKSILPSSPLATVHSTTGRKKPPPPSSRHGKLIKVELGPGDTAQATEGATSPVPVDTSLTNIALSRDASGHSITPLHSPTATTDVNKPLPLPPSRPSEEVDSPFDREAAGKVPETFAELQAHPRPPTPPPTVRNRSSSQTSVQSRSKPAAPPPRRHGRSDSRVPSINTNADEDHPRSSIESNRSRADSIRVNISSDKTPNAPAPPPPRRPQHARQGSSYASPTYGNFMPASPSGSDRERSVSGGLGPVTSGAHVASTSLATITTGPDGAQKLSPPPPPPTRQASTRRPASVRSLEVSGSSTSTRRVSKEKDGGIAPPPPPPRVRGSSKIAASAVAPHPESTDPSSMVETSQTHTSGTQPEGASDKHGEEILADLSALQREVDALMGKYPPSGGS
ncbi:hypothetical protein F5Y15DRAFT_381709 [Xylariaceae sp. FL0016]|nr:hypothetical protein F5Y15DRAFT_381709 [Xylariaceae sp. FL0016]